MTLTTDRLTIELTGHYFYAGRSGGRGVFLRFRSGFPFLDFERRRDDTGAEVWAFGMHLQIDGKALGAVGIA